MTAVTEDRVGKIGSSDIAAVLGRNTHCSPRMAWQTITGRRKVEENDHMFAGKELEPGIANIYARQNKAALFPAKRIVHPKLPWLIASIDRVAFRDGEVPWIVEIKAPATWGAWRKGMPDMYAVQVQHQLGIALERGGVALEAMHGDQPQQSDGINTRADLVAHCGRPKTFEIVHDPAELERMWNQTVDWHARYVVKDTPPPEIDVDHPEAVAAREVSAEVHELCRGLAMRKLAIKKLEEEAETLADCLREEFGPFHAIAHEGKVIATNKPNVVRRLDTKALAAELLPEVLARYTVTDTQHRLLLKGE